MTRAFFGYKPVLLELDMSDAYLAHVVTLPTGTSYWFNGGHTTPFITYFAECDVTVHDSLPLGPFPYRKRERRGDKVEYPVQPGNYHTYLWKEQIDDAKQAGCSVQVHNGVGWKYTTSDMRFFARFMHAHRRWLAGSPLEHYCKKIAVSGLGHFGMDYNFFRIVEDGEDNEPAMPGPGGVPLRYHVREYFDYNRPAMLHWYNYFIMQCARTLYKYALPYAIEKRLIMTNYDALLIVEKDERERYAQKHSLSSLMCSAGDLRWQELTNVTVIGDRSLICDQKTITPGVSHPVEEVVLI